MKIATVRVDGRDWVALAGEQGDEIGLLVPGSVDELLGSGSDWLDRVATMTPKIRRYDDVVFRPLVSRAQVLCVGLNYRDHVLEMGREIPEVPTIFTKGPQALCGAFDPITLPEVSQQVDYEGELVVVIGRPVRGVSEEAAVGAIAGYSVMNDVSMRDWQKRTTQWWQGKNFEASSPVGPWLVTPQEAGPWQDLEVVTRVNGEVRQRSQCANLIFSPEALVAYVSQFTTLRPGDLIATGTPGGVIAGSSNPKWLADGDCVSVAIEGVEECRNTFHDHNLAATV
ncbi:UNVERIFIED_ORG: acylpyruvate hydrolase [Gordonia westfalica J30]